MCSMSVKIHVTRRKILKSLHIYTHVSSSQHSCSCMYKGKLERKLVHLYYIQFTGFQLLRYPFRHCQSMNRVIPHLYSGLNRLFSSIHKERLPPTQVLTSSCKWIFQILLPASAGRWTKLVLAQVLNPRFEYTHQRLNSCSQKWNGTSTTTRPEKISQQPTPIPVAIIFPAGVKYPAIKRLVPQARVKDRPSRH